MRKEAPSLLALLTAAALSGITGPTAPGDRPVSLTDQPERDIIASLRVSVQERARANGIEFLDQNDQNRPDNKLAQYYGPPRFYNNFYNCFNGYWRNC